MKVITPEGYVAIHECYRAPTYTELVKLTSGRDDAEGGLEALKTFTTMPGKPGQKCVAVIYDEDLFDDLPINEEACLLWAQAQVNDGTFPTVEQALGADIICGSLVLLWGNDAFMTALWHS